MVTFPEEFPATKIEKGSGKSLRENITQVLREGIYSGYLPPGSKLVESVLANRFKISRTPIREAVLQLESEGLVKTSPNKGAIVNIYSIDDVDEIYTIFGALSGAAASLSVEFISEDELKQMEACIAKMETRKDDRDRKEYFVLNNEFHSTFLKPCAKRLLLKLIKNYTRQVGTYWYLLLSHPRNMELFSEEHRSILEAFKAKNSKGAKERVENHIRSLGNIVVESLRSISALQSGYPPSQKRSISFKAPVISSLDLDKVKERG